MIVFESRIARRFVGRLERGEEVIATLRQLCEHERIRAAWIHGAGMLEWVELTEWDPDREAWRAPRRVEGPLTVLSLEGNVSIRNGPPWVQLHVMLARQTGAGTVETLGGTVAAARVYALDFAFDVYEDVRLERDEDATTGLSLFKGSSVRGVFARSGERTQELARPRPAASSPVASRPAERGEPDDEDPPSSAPAPAVPSAATGAVSWAAAAAVSQEAEKRAAAMPARRERPAPGPPNLPPLISTSPVKAIPIPEARERDTSFLDEPIPQKGDYVDHRQFGLCRVDGEDEDGGLRIRLPSGVRKVIRLDFLEVLPPRHEGERKVFPLRPRKR